MSNLLLVACGSAIAYGRRVKLKIFSNKDDFESKRGITKDSSMCGAIFLV
ncbi:hypothetical protein [Nostoc sp. DSM 114159]